MKNCKTEDTLMLVGGALLGAAALYLLDPKSGQRRRQRLTRAARGAYDTTKHAVEEKWDDLAGHTRDLAQRISGETTGWHQSAADSAHALAAQAREITHRLSDRAHGEGSHVRDWGGRLLDRARDVMGKFTRLGSSISGSARHGYDDAAERAHEWGHWLAGRTDKAARKARSLWNSGEHHEEHHGAGAALFTTTAIGCCAVGAGLMYFLDPDRGHSRRAFLDDKAGRLVRDTGRTMHAAGRAVAGYARHLFYGSRAAASNFIGRERVDSEQLISRIRAELGHYSPHARQVQLMADADGTVTLTGAVPQCDVDGMLTTIHRIPGVMHVINRMDVGQQTERMHVQPVYSASTGRQ